MSGDPRLSEILEVLQDIAAGDLGRRVEISPAHDELDALAHVVNVVGGELAFAMQQLSRARDQAERASAAKSEFLRNISHEIRTPLSVILGITEILQNPSLADARRHELYARIATHVRAQADLLDDLLDMSRVEAGKLVVEPRPLGLRGLLAEVVASLESAALKKGDLLVLDAGGAPGRELQVLADRRRVRQILVNVIGNAIKFTTHGRIEVRARMGGDDVVIEVTDTGIGVDPAHVEQLFDPFAQADASIARRFGGSGLGLALSRGLAREMAGELAIVTTAPGMGTTLRLSLPAWHGLDDVAGPEEATPAPQRALDGVCVLLVDDHEDVRAPMATLLASRGATVLEAGSGVEAVQVGVRDAIDLILMDVRMPDVDGLEATRRLRGRGVLVPIVALTADVLADRPEVFADAGCTTHLAKPVDIERLVEVIHELCPNRVP